MTTDLVKENGATLLIIYLYNSIPLLGHDLVDLWNHNKVGRPDAHARSVTVWKISGIVVH